MTFSTTFPGEWQFFFSIVHNTTTHEPSYLHTWHDKYFIRCFTVSYISFLPSFDVWGILHCSLRTEAIRKTVLHMEQFFFFFFSSTSGSSDPSVWCPDRSVIQNCHMKSGPFHHILFIRSWKDCLLETQCALFLHISTDLIKLSLIFASWGSLRWWSDHKINIK